MADEHGTARITARLRDVDEPNALIVRRHAADYIEKLEADRSWLLAEVDRQAKLLRRDDLP